ncbi:hypothetical protein N9O92_02095 [Amylibacter sp.]|nr:hypothetical protein [Amylibacter sp.]
MKYFLSICVLGLIANSSFAGVMPEETNVPKIKQTQTKSNNLNNKLSNKNQKFENAQQGELYKINNTNIYAYRTSKNIVTR